MDARGDALSSFETKAGLCQPIAVGRICAIYQYFRVVQRHILHKSYAREQSGGGGTDVRRPIRPDSEDTVIMCIKGIQRLKDSVISSNLQDPFATQSKAPPVVGPQEAYDVDPVLALDV